MLALSVACCCCYQDALRDRGQQDEGVSAGDRQELMDALAELFLVDCQYEKALSVYLDQVSDSRRRCCNFRRFRRRVLLNSCCHCCRCWLAQRAIDPRTCSVVLSLVQDHNLFHVVQDKLLQIATGDPQRTVALLVENIDKVRQHITVAIVHVRVRVRVDAGCRTIPVRGNPARCALLVRLWILPVPDIFGSGAASWRPPD